ncbi:tetratricopeptide repeat protein [Candidatus Bipolaricaulota bacterium]
MTRADPPFFTLSVEDFDRSLLDGDAGEPGTESFLSAVKQFFNREYQSLGGSIEVEIAQNKIRVSWKPDRFRPEYVDMAVSKLQRKEYRDGMSILQSLLQFSPDDESVLYNLGMAESDMGELTQAEIHLRHLVEIQPRSPNAYVALGVALKRQHKDADAIQALEQAVKLDPNNAHAQRNLGACLLSNGDAEAAEDCLSKALQWGQEDARSWVGLAQSREAQGKLEEADTAYEKAIAFGQDSDVAEVAREARSRLARSEYEKRASGNLRMDAVMYCLDAMQKFDSMGEESVRGTTLEIALLGRDGLDVNDPEKKYTLSSLEGRYSGLQLVCMMYVGFKHLGIDKEPGFDLSDEYAEATRLRRNKAAE